MAVIVIANHSGSKKDSTPAVPVATSHIAVVASQSFCIPTGISDVYTGEGKVEFFLTFHNSGSASGTVDAVPVRHYDDGAENNSAMDMVSVDVAAGQTWKGHTAAMTYKAHEHEVIGCGVEINGVEKRIGVQ